MFDTLPPTQLPLLAFQQLHDVHGSHAAAFDHYLQPRVQAASPTVASQLAEGSLCMTTAASWTQVLHSAQALLAQTCGKFDCLC